ncbi:enoyl-CoA hydratase/isomerase family protein [Janibacter cremeus]|uniref:2-(1,2-epoxy-1,2-dihydrophenyl)acetyl-CoA isomerase n=1 Tax=Janibacter cremeus TaxID=1285192 RepID=A0A852VM42_9MICO|nr:enoyl-CoA hydratase/isomerase family protein [Janibacter cremeus]NYF98147.1 2-(1,2-epoxy-1,2-dihydrophenyl)acetyl-CoA isomerase [Janibacter cremeus]
MDQAVTLTVADGVGHIQLNRPEAANTIDMDLARALGEAAVAAGDDEAVRAVLLSGAGKRFCGGGDIASFAESDDPGADLLALADAADGAVLALEALDKPVVTAVHGAVAGGGLGIMLAGDVVVAAEGTKFVFAYPAIGLTPDCGTSTALPLTMGRQRALAFALRDQPLSAQEAREQGLVAEVVADPLARARKLAAAWARGSSAAYGQTRRLLRAGADRPRTQSGRDEADTLGRRAGTPEAQALFAKFLGR